MLEENAVMVDKRCIGIIREVLPYSCVYDIYTLDFQPLARQTEETESLLADITEGSTILGQESLIKHLDDKGLIDIPDIVGLIHYYGNKKGLKCKPYSGQDNVILCKKGFDFTPLFEGTYDKALRFLLKYKK